MWSRWKAGRAFAIGLLAAFLVAGCGGDDGGGDSSAAEWADDVCSATVTWNESIQSTLDSLTAGNLSEEELRGAVDDIESATSDFADDLRGLGRPDTEAGQRAQESLDQLADDIEEGVATIRSAVDEASGAGGIVEAATTAGAALTTMGEQLSSTFGELEDLDAGGELEAAFNEADSCNELESGQG